MPDTCKDSIGVVLTLQILDLVAHSGATHVEAACAIGAARELLLSVNLRRAASPDFWEPVSAQEG